ncbi:Bgt-1085 [Blumeria graminis f. sp. tritici]|uniref:Bgt-1085 n=2 Tax=Blumeria graminis f. sp. tritici TaxID=62690 RepID=A0A9X9MIV5_BLUGR|nr:Bgt-1085 [Blumeria graminis f. sp. tritici]
MSLVEKNNLYCTAKHDEGLAAEGDPTDRRELQLLREAEEAQMLEKNMAIGTAVKLWWPAILFSVAVSTGVIMEGYDNLLLAQFYALPAFCKRYGAPIGENGAYEIPPAWQAGLSNGVMVGEIIGLHINAAAIDRFGYKKTMYGALIAICSFIFIPFFAPNLIVLLVGEILCGIPWGVFQTLTCSYASDVCPVKLRPFLTTYTNLCWVIGQLIGSGVLRGLVERPDQWSYRIPFAIQWFWPVPITIAIIFAPESPWWLVRHDRLEDARKSIVTLTSTKDAPASFSIDKTLSMIVVTNNMEMANSMTAGYADCFRGTNLRRTEISCITWVIQNLCGSAFMGYSTYFYVRAGLPTVMAFNMTLVQYAIGFGGTFASWSLMGKFGRRTLFLTGLTGLFFVLLSIGICGMIDNKASGWAIGSLLVLYTAIYDSSIGPLTYSLVSEIPSTRLKNKTVVLARNVFNLAGMMNYIIVPYMLNPAAWNWGGKSGFFWAGVCCLCLLWAFFRLPEPKDRSYAELDELFEKKISARKFSSTILHQTG